MLKLTEMMAGRRHNGDVAREAHARGVVDARRNATEGELHRLRRSFGDLTAEVRGAEDQPRERAALWLGQIKELSNQLASVRSDIACSPDLAAVQPLQQEVNGLVANLLAAVVDRIGPQAIERFKGDLAEVARHTGTVAVGGTTQQKLFGLADSKTQELSVTMKGDLLVLRESHWPHQKFGDVQLVVRRSGGERRIKPDSPEFRLEAPEREFSSHKQQLEARTAAAQVERGDTVELVIAGVVQQQWQMV